MKGLIFGGVCENNSCAFPLSPLLAILIMLLSVMHLNNHFSLIKLSILQFPGCDWKGTSQFWPGITIDSPFKLSFFLDETCFLSTLWILSLNRNLCIIIPFTA